MAAAGPPPPLDCSVLEIVQSVAGAEGVEDWRVLWRSALEAMGGRRPQKSKPTVPPPVVKLPRIVARRGDTALKDLLEDVSRQKKERLLSMLMDIERDLSANDDPSSPRGGRRRRRGRRRRGFYDDD